MSSKPIPNFDNFSHGICINKWPPETPIPLHKGDNTNYIVGISPHERIEIVSRPDANGKSKSWVSQPFEPVLSPDLNKSGHEMLNFCLDFRVNISDVNNLTGVTVWVNQVKLLDLPLKMLIPVEYIQLKSEKIYESISYNMTHTNKEEWLFIQTLKELENRVLLGSNYDLIKASGLIRSLIAEEAPNYSGPTKSLGVRLSDKYNVPLTFEIADQVRKPDAHQLNAITNLPDEGTSYSYYVWENFYPERPTVSLNREDFLNTVVLWTGSETTTIYTVIKTLAESGGGIHYGPPMTMKQEKGRLLSFEEEGVLPAPLSWRFMPQISRVVLKSFLPLAQLISQKIS